MPGRDLIRVSHTAKARDEAKIMAERIISISGGHGPTPFMKPRSPTQDFQRSALGSLRVSGGGPGIIRRIVPIAAPLPDAGHHVVQSKTVGRVRPHRSAGMKTLHIRLIGAEGVAVGIFSTF